MGGGFRGNGSHYMDNQQVRQEGYNDRVGRTVGKLIDSDFFCNGNSDRPSIGQSEQYGSPFSLNVCVCVNIILYIFLYSIMIIVWSIFNKQKILSFILSIYSKKKRNSV